LWPAASKEYFPDFHYRNRPDVAEGAEVMLSIKKQSAWKFQTSSSGGIGVEFVAAEFGTIYMTDPKGNYQGLRYGGAGVGLSAGLKLPKVGKLSLPQVKGKSVGAVAAPTFFPNWGKLYILDTFKGTELTRADITGVCIFVEIAAGVIGGGAAMGMLLGMDPAWLGAIAAAVEFPPIAVLAQTKLLQSATGVFITAGATAGYQAGYGGAAFLGGLY
jgi:hypothetical protein